MFKRIPHLGSGLKTRVGAALAAVVMCLVCLGGVLGLFASASGELNVVLANAPPHSAAGAFAVDAHRKPKAG